MLVTNDIPLSKRLKELFIDYIFIIGYLAILFSITITMYFVIFESIPEFSESKTQLIALFTSVIPIILIFSLLDYKKGSIGKRKAGLKLYYNNKTFVSSLIRNIIKFLPWQLGHLATIHGMYSNYDALAIIISILSIVLALTLLMMVIMRKDKRHLGDLLAKTQVQVIN